MMSRENEEIVRRIVDAFNTRSLELWAELVTWDFEFVPYLASVVANTSYRGLDGVRRYFEDVDEAWTEIRVWVDEVRDAEEGFVAFGGLSASGKASGVETEAALAWVVELRKGKVISARSYSEAGEALEAAGLSE